MPTRKHIRKATTKGRTFVNIILDESGSMMTTLKETISGVNNYLESLAKTPRCYVTLTKFNTRTNVLYAMEPVKKATTLGGDNYLPSGYTALYDAIGVCVQAMRKEVKKNDRVLTVIVTDGMENASKEWTRAQVKTLISDLEQAGNWTTTFLAANIDTQAFAAATGMSLGNTFSYQATSVGTRQAFDSLTSATANYMASTQDGNLKMSNFYDPTTAPTAVVSRVELGRPKRRTIPLTFTHNGFAYRLEFEHEQFNPPIEVDTEYRGRRKISALTSALVWERPAGNPPTDEAIFVTGRSMCSVDDRFNKEQGRERALKRLVRELDPTQEREIRGKILSAYYTRNGKK